jgi:hypothetical protein
MSNSSIPDYVLWIGVPVLYLLSIWVTSRLLQQLRPEDSIDLTHDEPKKQAAAVSREDILFCGFLAFCLASITPAPYFFHGPSGLGAWPAVWTLLKAIDPPRPFANMDYQISMIVLYSIIYGIYTRLWLPITIKLLQRYRQLRDAVGRLFTRASPASTSKPAITPIARIVISDDGTSITPIKPEPSTLGATRSAARNIALWGGLLIIAINGYQFWTEFSSLEAQLKRALPNINKDLPKMLDDSIRQEKARVNGKTLHLIFTLTETIDKNELASAREEYNALQAHVKDSLVNTFCKQLPNEFERGMMIKYNASDPTGLKVFYSTITHADCLSRNKHPVKPKQKPKPVTDDKPIQA